MKIFSIIVRYWAGSGSSKPHSSRMLATSCGVAFLPAMLSAGSLFGITLKIRKTSTEIANSTATIPTSRLTAKRAISRLLLRLEGPGVGLQPHLRLRVERVAHTVAEDVQRQHREQDHQPGAIVSSGAL